MDIENAKAQMRKGVLEMCILAIISEEESYPGDIIDRLKRNDLIVVEGTLYPLLTRLKNDGLLNYSWRESTTGPPRKYFKLTDNGSQFLGDLAGSWRQLVNSVGQTIDSVPEPSANGRAAAKTAETPPPEPAAAAPEPTPEPTQTPLNQFFED